MTGEQVLCAILLKRHNNENNDKLNDYVFVLYSGSVKWQSSRNDTDAWSLQAVVVAALAPSLAHE